MRDPHREKRQPRPRKRRCEGEEGVKRGGQGGRGRGVKGKRRKGRIFTFTGTMKVYRRSRAWMPRNW
eukprot:669035-Hanusia_phi.AAC.1